MFNDIKQNAHVNDLGAVHKLRFDRREWGRGEELILGA